MAEYARIGRSSLSGDIANELQRMIYEEVLKVGHKLPSEQELAQKFGVSRNILREALKTLKERGLILVRNGDGTYVERLKPEILINVVDRFVRLTDVTLRDVFELRCAIEVEASGLAAERAEPADIDKLQKIIENMKANQSDVRRWTEEELRFHLTIAEATKNPLFPCFIKALATQLYDLFAKGFYKPGGHKYGIEGHTAILESVKARARAKAEKAMLVHLSASRKNLLEEDSRHAAEEARG